MSIMASHITYKEIDTTIRGDATPQIKGFLYQFLVALEFCFEMKVGQILYIEKFGDLAIKANEEGGSLSVETKLYSDKIHLLHHNVVNTLYNWAQPNFHQEQYSRLFLITTQEIRDDDDLLKIGNQKSSYLYTIITDKLKAESVRIKEKLEEEKKKNPDAKLRKEQQNTVDKLDYLTAESQKDVVEGIVGKWVLSTGCYEFKELYENILNRYASMLEDRKRELYIDGLFAMIINPGILEKGWCISREEFEKRQQDLNADFSLKTITFPTIGEPSEEEQKGLGSSLFVEKLRIVKLEQEIAKAIHDYAKTNKLIMEEIKGRPVRDQGLEKYKENLKELFTTQYNFHTVDFNYNPEQNVFKSSQKFYYAMQNACIKLDMSPFSAVDLYFAKGVLHILADDRTLNVKWEIDGTSI